MTKPRRQNEQLRAAISNLSPRQYYDLIFVDALTDALNRRAFDALNRRVFDGRADVRSYAVIDIDSLHSFNHLFGHENGDELIKLVISTIMDVMPDLDVYRIGGDEIVVTSSCSTAIDLDEVRLALIGSPSSLFPDGMRVGGPFSVGYGTSYTEADRDLLADKERRTYLGLRSAARDSRPAYLI